MKAKSYADLASEHGECARCLGSVLLFETMRQPDTRMLICIDRARCNQSRETWSGYPYGLAERLSEQHQGWCFITDVFTMETAW